MYVLVFIPEKADPEVFGPFPTPQKAVNLLRRITTAAGGQIDIESWWTVDISIDDERHRYQILKVGSTDQIDAHAHVIEQLRASARITVESRPSPPPPSTLSGY